MKLGYSSSLGEGLPQDPCQARPSDLDHSTKWYRLADAALALTITDLAFQQRFDYLFQECRFRPAQGQSVRHVQLDIRPMDSDRATAVFSSPDPLNFRRFAAVAL